MAESIEQPLGKIALALSGGGYRAAAFHLGTLDVLHALGLLPEVVALSTVSGGTIVGAAYALAAVRREPFAQFHAQFYRQLQERPLELALRLLQGQPAAELPAATLIAAAAAAYDTVFFHDARFGELLDRDRPSHLNEIAFNATDFAWGLPFRFQHSQHSPVRIGNGRHSIPRRAARKLRIADIVAASSCFPGGFEPIRFPDDFHWDDRRQIGQLLGKRVAEQFCPPVPLMDGGVADNQGLNSLLAAVRRIDRSDLPAQRIGLIILSDVDRPAEEPLLVVEPPTLGRLRVRHVVLLGKLFWLLAVGVVLATGGQLVRAAVSGCIDWSRDVLLLVLPLLFALLVAGSLVWLRRWIRRQLTGRLEAIRGDFSWGVDLVAFARQLPVSQLIDLLQMRVKSLLTMSGSVFMKSIRDLRYRGVFADRRYRERVVANLIYELATPWRPGSAELPSWLQPSAEIRGIAACARKMPTILWFQSPEQLPAVVACGRHTACYNLLAHLCRRYGPELTGADDKTRETFARARRLWQQFQDAPLLPTETALDIDAVVRRTE